MYDVKIKNGNQTEMLHNHRLGYDLPAVSSGQIVDAVNEISTFSFTVLPNNPVYERLQPFSTLVEVVNTKKSVNDFSGRIYQVNPSMDSSGLVYKSVVCEDRKAYLQDSIQPYMQEQQFEGDETRNGLQEFIDLILSNHNSQVEDYKKIYRGDVTVTSFSTGGVYKSLNYETTWTIIKEKLIGSFGGEIALRESDGLLYLDYKDDIGVTRATEIKLAKNLQDSTEELDPSAIVTRLIPLGHKLSETTVDDDGNSTETETEKRLTIESVNDGKLYIEDATAKDLYGIILKTAEFSDVTDASNLLSKGQEWLAQNNTVKASYKITAIDLSLIDLDIDAFTLHDSYPVENRLIDLDATLEVIKKTTNILEPSSSSIELGDKEVLLSDLLVDYNKVINNVSQEVSQVQTDTKNNVNGVVTNFNKSLTVLEQTINRITASVEEEFVTSTEYETFKETMKNILSMDADGTTMIFQTINEAIEEVNGSLNTKWNELITYFKFSDDGLIIGKSDSAITLTLENNVLTFKQNGVSVAYFDNNKLYVYDGEFTHSLTLGNFGFLPRTNGNLSFKKIK